MNLKQNKTISINGHVLDRALLVDDPDVKRIVIDADRQERHIRVFNHPAPLKGYLKKHPEGIVVAGAGIFFLLEPVPVSSAMVKFDENGNANILIKEGAEDIEKQLKLMEAIRDAASEQIGRL